MKISTYILILFLIFLLSSISANLLYSYMDPERSLAVAYAMMGTALTLGSASFIAMLLYFFKKIYYRGIVSVGVMNACVRQWFLLAWGLLWIAVFHKLGILNYKTGGLLFFIILLFELMIQSLVEDD